MHEMTMIERFNVIGLKCICTYIFSFYPCFLSEYVNPAGSYLFKINNGNTRTMCEICLTLTINTSELRPLNRLHWCFHYWLWTSKCWLVMEIFLSVYVMLCAIWYHLYNLKNKESPGRSVNSSKVGVFRKQLFL